MRKFELKTETIELRGEKYTVAELTAGKKSQWAELCSENKYGHLYTLVSLTLVDPKLTIEEAMELPSDVCEALADVAMQLSGVKTDEKPNEKKH